MDKVTETRERKPKFIQIAAMPSDGTTHSSGIFALDEAGTVWHYEGQYGWIAFTDLRSKEIDSPKKGESRYEEIP